VQRRQRLHANRYLPGGHVLRVEPRNVHRERSVPYGRHVLSGDRRLFESGGAERLGL
jgi:hypothetical protein